MARATALPLPVPPTLALALTLTLLVLSAATAAAAAANDGNKPDRALLALDRVVSGALVAGRNATVEYVVANVGAGTATEVSLKDLSFPSSRFQVHSGGFRHTFPSLPSGSRFSHSVLMTPKRAGELHVSPATVSYFDSTGRGRSTRLAADDTVLVEDLLSYRRRTDKHAAEWMAFGVGFLLLVLGPAVVSGVVERGMEKTGVAKKKS